VVQVPDRNNTDLTKINQAIAQLDQGRLNCSGTFTLVAGATTTTVEAPTVAVGTPIHFSPMSADAAAAMATTFVLPANVSNGSFIVSHAISGSTDRTFSWVGIG
jgi:hypothetical protein